MRWLHVCSTQYNKTNLDGRFVVRWEHHDATENETNESRLSGFCHQTTRRNLMTRNIIEYLLLDVSLDEIFLKLEVDHCHCC